jgi:hypothetical protein
MDQNIKLHFEKKFRDLNSSGELFDAFRDAIRNKIKDADLYKILLGNIALSPFEIKMFTDKLCTMFPDLSYDLLMWTANILENCSAKNNIELAVEYYKKAAEADGLTHLPYYSIVKIYNPEFDNPPQEELLSLLQRGLEKVRYKSKIYFALAELYGKLNNLPFKHKYTLLAHKSAREEG